MGSWQSLVWVNVITLCGTVMLPVGITRRFHLVKLLVVAEASPQQLEDPTGILWHRWRERHSPSRKRSRILRRPKVQTSDSDASKSRKCSRFVQP